MKKLTYIEVKQLKNARTISSACAWEICKNHTQCKACALKNENGSCKPIQFGALVDYYIINCETLEKFLKRMEDVLQGYISALFTAHVAVSGETYRFNIMCKTQPIGFSIYLPSCVIETSEEALPYTLKNIAKWLEKGYYERVSK